MTQQDTAEAAAASPLEEALAKNVDATEEVKRAVDELTIVRAVLEKPEGTPLEDIDMAVDRAESLEADLSSAAEKLEEVNDTLAEELRVRGASND